MNLTSLDMRRKALTTRGKIALAAVALLVSPVIWMVVKGLVGLAAAALVGGAIIAFAPVVAMKFANWKVKAIKAEATKNPIETLENLILSKRQAFLQFKAAVETGITARDNFAQRTAAFKKQYPARAAEFEQSLANMTAVMEQKKQALRDAQESLRDADHKLEEMRAYWEMSQAAQDANSKTGMDTGDLYEKMKADTAVDAVYASVNRAFAQLEVAATLSDAAPALENNASPTIDVHAVEVRERLHA